MLDEIETLRSKLSEMETAVVSGSQSPSLVKFMLSNALNPQAPPSPGMMMNPRPSYPPQSPGGMMQQQPSFGAPLQPSYGVPQQVYVGMPQGPGPVQGRPGSQGNRPMLAPLPNTATSVIQGSYPTMMSPNMNHHQTPQHPPPQQLQQHPQVMSMGGQGASGGNKAVSGGIIVGDPSKMAMLLGVGGPPQPPMGLGQQQQFMAMSGAYATPNPQSSPVPISRPVPVKPNSSAGRK